ncbi:MAG: hypothetical protein J2P25_22155 [Nocardiopsaceae bacterium]|nr:hypothetical protein [Nocardiopsaceae bacterium]
MGPAADTVPDGHDPASVALWPERPDKAFDRDIAQCSALLTAGRGPHYIAHATYGLRDFGAGAPDRWAPGTTEQALDNAGSQLNLMVTQLDVACEPLDSGPLIRVVVQGDSGALFHFVKVPGQAFFAVLFDGAADAVHQADRALAELARASVERIGGRPLLWGGFTRRENSDELWVPYQAAKGAPGPVRPAFAGPGDDVPEAAAQACGAALSPDDLHAIGIYRRGQVAWATDIFETPALAPLFQRVTPKSRRRGYARVADQVRLQTRRIYRLLEVTGSGRLERLVLDVARGAIYALPLGGDDYLVGVTLVQSRVDDADQKMRALHERILPLWQSSGTRPAQ